MRVSDVADQPLGEQLEWQPAPWPERRQHRGRLVVVRPLDPERDTEQLYALSHEPTGDPSIWTYLYEGPFASVEAYRRHLESNALSDDPLFFVITDAADQRQLGQITYMSIEPIHGSIELGSIWFSRALQRTPAATEAIFLLAAHAFDGLGYRRLEWKCNALNAPSRNAALRYGFLYEGLLPPPPRGQGSQPRHRVVRDHGRALAVRPQRVRDLACTRKLRTGRGAGSSAARSDSCNRCKLKPI